MTEQLIVEHGSPTLAGLKPGNLISVPATPTVDAELREISRRLAMKGVVVTPLRSVGTKVSVYLFRPKQLKTVLACPAVQRFLRSQGYADLSVAGALRTLRTHLREAEFPHEIGVFLGYPLSDVIAFMRDGGRHCLVCGCWKAYSNECDARRIFAQFDKCREIYTRLWQEGRSLEKLTVAA